MVQPVAAAFESVLVVGGRTSCAVGRDVQAAPTAARPESAGVSQNLTKVRPYPRRFRNGSGQDSPVPVRYALGAFHVGLGIQYPRGLGNEASA
jgi:hypothetical protein